MEDSIPEALSCNYPIGSVMSQTDLPDDPTQAQLDEMFAPLILRYSRYSDPWSDNEILELVRETSSREEHLRCDTDLGYVEDMPVPSHVLPIY